MVVLFSVFTASVVALIVILQIVVVLAQIEHCNFRRGHGLPQEFVGFGLLCFTLG